MRTSRPSIARRALGAAASALIALGLFTACGAGGDDEAEGDVNTAENFDFQCPEREDAERAPDEEANENTPFVFGSPGNPSSMDPVFASDGETFRVTRQVFDTLLKHDCTEIVPGLAESYEQNETGTEWTFHLREGVTFHDGTPLDGAAVCANFDRWYNFTGGYQSPNYTYYYSSFFGGFKENDPDMGIEAESNYAGCEADGLTATVKIHEYTANFPGAFSMATTAIVSPASLAQITDDQVKTADDPLPEYTQTAGVLAGTGPYKFVDWDHSAQSLTLERFDDYWGEPAKVKTLIFRTISDETARRQALEAGDIQGYDLVAPADVVPLQEAGFQVPTRGVFNILYMTYNQLDERLADHTVREALSYAVNRQRLVNSVLPPGGTVATQFMPPSLDGWSEDVVKYEYDPDKAEELLAEAGQEDMTIKFCYPTDVSRPYMPAPKDIFDIIAADLEAVGVTVEATPITWVEYIPATRSGDCPLYLLGWTGDFNEAYNFLGTWFSTETTEWGFDNQAIFDGLAEAAAEPDPAVRAEHWTELNEMIMEELPGLPISHSPPSIAFAPEIYPMDVSPLTQEDFSDLYFAAE
ncbi:ABC transporter substrate-binding protein [Glycomyces arizonensis]|uniref:ABC transporter substrate-binding protein n=1 Tax=Glycomyces arizonensis TaxID=256035 RepID=UPI0004046E1B|nr:ABC transporter substrate-binding protein [Glycomyces arizonensis]